jgi:hypothetical protein
MLDWREDKINELALELAKNLASNVKEGNWYLYSLRFKKDKNGQIIISDPSLDEIDVIKKLKDK